MRAAWTRLLPAVVLCCAAPCVGACVIFNFDAARAEVETDTTVVGEIVEMLPPIDESSARHRRFRVRVLHVERGAAEVGAVIEIDLVHMRASKLPDGTVRCPIVRGSGDEDGYVRGTRARLMLRSGDDVSALYWSERIDP